MFVFRSLDNATYYCLFRVGNMWAILYVYVFIYLFIGIFKDFYNKIFQYLPLA